jgi:hypothetical protein
MLGVKHKVLHMLGKPSTTEWILKINKRIHSLLHISSPPTNLSCLTTLSSLRDEEMKCL